MEVQSILQKNALNIPSRIHLTLVARIVVYSIKTNSAKTKGEDLILENKDTRHQGALPDPDGSAHAVDAGHRAEVHRAALWRAPDFAQVRAGRVVLRPADAERAGVVRGSPSSDCCASG